MNVKIKHVFWDIDRRDLYLLGVNALFTWFKRKSVEVIFSRDKEPLSKWIFADLECAISNILEVYSPVHPLSLTALNWIAWLLHVDWLEESQQNIRIETLLFPLMKISLGYRYRLITFCQVSHLPGKSFQSWKE